MAEMDAALTKAKDQVFKYEITTEAPGKQPRAMVITVNVKGTLTLTEFHAPADLAGTKVLVRARNQMYIWLPAYRKVRRIGSHVTDQGFMGTTYSHAEMSALDYGSAYTATLLSETDDRFILEMTPKEDAAEIPYAKLQIEVDKKVMQPAEIRYFNDKGDKVKTEIRTEYSCDESLACNAATMRMTDHTRSETWTEFRRKEWTANPGLSDDLFTLRSLQSGR